MGSLLQKSVGSNMGKLVIDVGLELTGVYDNGRTIEAGGYHMFAHQITKMHLHGRWLWFKPKLVLISPGKHFTIRGDYFELQKLLEKIDNHASLLGI